MPHPYQIEIGLRRAAPVSLGQGTATLCFRHTQPSIPLEAKQHANGGNRSARGSTGVEGYSPMTLSVATIISPIASSSVATVRMTGVVALVWVAAASCSAASSA